MLRQLRRSVGRVVGLTALCVFAPLLLAVGLWGLRGGSPITVSPMAAIAFLSALTVTLAAVATVVGFLEVRGLTARIVPALGRLADRTDRIDEGVHHREFPPTGIPEIDELTAALSRGTALASKRLAAERTFAADASHQLRTPLTALLMRLEEISSTENLDVVAEESHIAIAQVERLSSVVDDLLARSRSGADRPPSVSLDSVLAALQREWQPTYAVRRRAIHITGARGLRVLGAPGPLSQIFSTLLENSLVHGAGTVTVEARRSGPSVIVEVHDEGAGIDPALAPHIFERSVSSRGSGLGLGLARDLASAQGGRLELVSASGAEFALFLSGAAD
ncbi:MAG: HAMP domain-containing histidine kinase [Tetrasphaera sp.]|nr:HAMP domain-containing histidine kinase [Tetrasphaera sp.]